MSQKRTQLIEADCSSLGSSTKKEPRQDCSEGSGVHHKRRCWMLLTLRRKLNPQESKGFAVTSYSDLLCFLAFSANNRAVGEGKKTFSNFLCWMLLERERDRDKSQHMFLCFTWIETATCSALFLPLL